MLNQWLARVKNLIKKNDEIAYRLKIVTLKISGFLSKYIDDKSFIEKQ